MVYQKDSERVKRARELYARHRTAHGTNSIPWKKFYLAVANGWSEDRLMTTNILNYPFKPRRTKAEMLGNSTHEKKRKKGTSINDMERMRHLYAKHQEKWGDEALSFPSFYARIHSMKWTDDRAINVKPIHRQASWHRERNSDFVSKPKKKKGGNWDWESAIIGFCSGVAACLLFAALK